MNQSKESELKTGMYQLSKSDQPLETQPDVDFIPLNISNQIVAIRKDIETNVQHKGRNYELVRAAINEIKAHFNKPPLGNRICRSACITNYNDLLKKWLKSFDLHYGFGTEVKLTPVTHEPLIPLKEVEGKDLNNESFSVLRDRLIAKTSLEFVQSLNNGKIPKKSVVIQELLKL